MEIKIQCSCGTRYKFDVEPVEGRLPGPVTCPSCGTEGTASANKIIQERLGAQPVPVQPSSIPALRVTFAAPIAPAPAGAESVSPAPKAWRSQVPAPQQPQRESSWKKAVSIVLICVGVYALGSKWYRRAQRVGGMASVIGAATVSDTEGETQWNLHADNGVILTVQAPDQALIAQKCIEFWQASLRKRLAIVAETVLTGTREYRVGQPYHGYVEIVGDLDWPKQQHESLAQYLSQSLNGLVFVERDVSFSGAFVFAVYEHGVKRFRAEMDMQIKNNEPIETVTTEGNEWAIEHHYKPGKAGFKEFNIGDANAITKRLGVKMWDRKPEEAEKEKPIFLKEF